MITLHHCPQTRSMRTLWLLHELDVDFQVQLHPFDKSLRAPEFLSLSPAGRVPALEIEGERMFETGAITEYLCERFSPDRMGRAWTSASGATARLPASRSPSPKTANTTAASTSTVASAYFMGRNLYSARRRRLAMHWHIPPSCPTPSATRA